jgi:hypothetical protein
MNRVKRVRKTASKVLAVAAAILLAAVFSFGGGDGYSGMPGGKWEAGLALGGAFPMGAFKNNLGHDGFSLDLWVGSRIKHSPFSVGGEVYFMIYGLRSHDEYLSSGIPLQVEVETSNNLLQGLVYLRCQPRRGRIRPYVEALAGLSYLFTRTSISGTEYPYDEIASSTNFDDLTFCWGGGVGMDIHLSGGRQTTSEVRGTETRLDLKVRYLAGGRAQYLRDDSIVYDSDRGTFTYLFRESTTNLLSVQAGISFNF